RTPAPLLVSRVLALRRGAQGPAIDGVAHVSGGGLTENIIRVVRDGLGLESEAPELPPVFDWLPREGAVPREEMWRTFNCGIGFVLVVATDAASTVGSELDRLGLAHRPIGRVVAADGERVRIG